MENFYGVSILKPGKSPLDTSLYSSIALSNCVSKAMEKIVHSCHKRHLGHTNAYPQSMSGFRQRRTSTDNVIDLVTSVQELKVDGSEVYRRSRLSCCQGTYKNMVHSSILRQMMDLGIGGRLRTWVSSFLPKNEYTYCFTR